ncbi:MAG TPA: sugar ABC transporter permease [Actinophytocola sp.]|jgi:ABC-type sugar transport system permease subunit|uniref:carbohydrate ABC transporter permease n=1 Tax=Actinophytocola sp. TaxID=1872138 RepID=UPI002F922634
MAQQTTTPATATRMPAGDARAAPRPARRRRGDRVAWLFVAPLALIFAGFYLWPAVQTILSSFFEWSLLAPFDPLDTSTWYPVGTDNYTAALSSDSFWNAAFNSLVWLIVFPVLVTGSALLVSVLIWHLGRFAPVFRTVFILPMTISLAAAGVIWSFVYNSDPDVGLLNAVLRVLRLDIAFDLGPLHVRTGEWLADIGSLDLGFAQLRLVNLALILPAVWAFAGFGVVTFTAGLSSLPGELVDSARIDGCRAGQVVRHVLIPHLRKPLIITYVVSVIFALRTFDIVYVMTEGGPAQDTTVLALLLWQQAFAFLTEPRAGVGAAIAVLMAVVMVFLAYPYLRSLMGGGSGDEAR